MLAPDSKKAVAEVEPAVQPLTVIENAVPPAVLPADASWEVDKVGSVTVWLPPPPTVHVELCSAPVKVMVPSEAQTPEANRAVATAARIEIGVFIELALLKR